MREPITRKAKAPTSTIVRRQPQIIAPPDIVTFIKDKKWLDLPLSLYQETLLRTAYGLPLLSPEQHRIYHECTGRSGAYTPRNYNQVTVVAGARSGKGAMVAAPVACYEAAFGGHHLKLSPGERGTIPVVAQDARAARIVFDFIKTYLQRTPACAALIDDIRSTEIDLKNKMTISIFPCTVKSLRGYAIPSGVMDELGYWRQDGAVDSDTEIETSILRGMPRYQGKLVKISTPYMRSGVLYNDFKLGYGAEHPSLLVWKASTSNMNPTMTEEMLASLKQRMDPSRFAREFLAEFVEDLETFLPQHLIDAAIMTGQTMLAPQPDRFVYSGGIDASGAGEDAFTASIVHDEIVDGDTHIVQDFLQGWRKSRGGTINLEGIVAEIAGTMHTHNIAAVYADHYAADWVVQSFARHGITIIHAPEKSVAYLELYPLLAQGRLDLLDHPIQARELALLERRQKPGGKISISHPSAGGHKHDDHANALALAVLMATQNLNAGTVPLEMSSDEIMAIRAAFGTFGPGSYNPNIFDNPETPYGTTRYGTFDL